MEYGNPSGFFMHDIKEKPLGQPLTKHVVGDVQSTFFMIG